MYINTLYIKYTILLAYFKIVYKRYTVRMVMYLHFLLNLKKTLILKFQIYAEVERLL